MGVPVVTLKGRGIHEQSLAENSALLMCCICKTLSLSRLFCAIVRRLADLKLAIAASKAQNVGASLLSAVQLGVHA